MAHYPFPSTQSHSPYYGYAYPPPTTPSSHSHYSTPRRRNNSFSHAYTPSTAYPAHNAQNYLAVPATTPSHRSRSRSRSSHGHTPTPHHHSRTHSQSRHHGHGYSASASMHTPSTAHSHLDTPSHQSHRYPSSAHSHHSHHSHAYSHAPSSHPTRQRTLSISDRIRQFFGLDPPYQHHSTNTGRRRHNSFSSYRDDTRLRRSNTRTGPLFFGPSDHRRFVDEHGREVDHRGRIIHRF